MSSKIHLAFVLLLLPLLVVAHDLYFWHEAKYNFANFRLSEVGFIWMEYAPDSYDAVVQFVGEETWETYAFPLMKLKTAALLGFPFMVFFIIRIWNYLKIVLFGGTVQRKSTKKGPAKQGGRNFSSKNSEYFFGSGKAKKPDKWGNR